MIIVIIPGLIHEVFQHITENQNFSVIIRILLNMPILLACVIVRFSAYRFRGREYLANAILQSMVMITGIERFIFLSPNKFDITPW